MTGLVILLGGITLFAGLVTLLDGIAHRRRKKEDREKLKAPPPVSPPGLDIPRPVR